MAANRTWFIDVSHWQGDVNWPLVATECRLAVAKASEGRGYRDPAFAKNYQGMHDAGLFRGAYHFARVSRPPGTSAAGFSRDAEDEADWYLEVIGTDRRRTLPPILDIEWDKRARGIRPPEIIDWCLAWLERVEQKTQRIPIVYTGRNYWRWKLAQTNALHRYTLWLAQYKKNAHGDGPKTPISGWPWKFWQYSSKGKVQGVSTPCDVNMFSGSPRDLEKFVAEAPYHQKPALESYHHADPILWDRLVCWAAETFSDRPA